MSDAQLQITVGADVSQVVSGMQSVEGELVQAQSQLNLLGRAIDIAISKGQDISQLEDAFQRVNDRVKQLTLSTQQLGTGGLGSVPAQLAAVEAPAEQLGTSMQRVGLTTSQARIAFIDFGRIATGQGFSLRALASNFSLLGPAATVGAAAIVGLIAVLARQSDAEKKAAEDAKRLQEFMLNLKSADQVTEQSTGSEEGNIARVQALAAVILDTNNAYKERQNALNELRETNKSYFGDLTLEQSSMKLLTDRVHEYAQALITEAVVKGQVEEIAKLSEELQKQIPILNAMAAAHEQLQDQLNKTTVEHKDDFGAAGGGSSAVLQAQDALDRNYNAYVKQNEIVATLKDQIRQYTDVLNDNIVAQSKERPLKIAPPPVDDLKSIIPVLEQIQRIYEDLSKPNKEPLFKQENLANQLRDPASTAFQVLQDKIQEAFANGITKGANDPKIKTAYDALATALQAQLRAQQNPNLLSHVDFTLQDPANATKLIDKYEAEIEKAASKSEGVRIPVHFELDLEAQGVNPQDAKKITRGLEQDPILKDLYFKATPHIKMAIEKDLIAKSDKEKLVLTIQEAMKDVAKEGFIDVGKTIGDLISGQKNPFQTAIKGFTTVLGDGLVKIGESMIEGSTAITVIQKALTALWGNAAGGIIAGVAAVAIGETIKNVGAHAFATGGIVTGPTLGLVGEAGPEVIFPLNQLNNFIKTSQPQPQRVIVEGRISGAHINIASARAAKLQNMTS
jgi:hypothetical protein